MVKPWENQWEKGGALMETYGKTDPRRNLWLNFMEIHRKPMTGNVVASHSVSLAQDGRSAIITAPSGPAQQRALQNSLRDAELPLGDGRAGGSLGKKMWG